MSRRKPFGALALVVALFCTLIGCSSSAPSPKQYVVIKVRPVLTTNAPDTYNEYDIVYYEPAPSSYKKRVGGEHANDLLTGYDIEYHFKRKYGWTKADVWDFVDKNFAYVDRLDFATLTVTQKKRVICLLIKFDDLDKNANVQALVDQGLFNLFGSSNKVDSRLSIDWLVTSLKISGSEVSQSHAHDIPLHFDAE